MRTPVKVTTHTYDDEDGEAYTRLSMFKVPDGWTRDQIDKWVADHFPGEHCQHSYDCCGRFYPSEGTWSFVGWGNAMFLVYQVYRLNI